MSGQTRENHSGQDNESPHGVWSFYLILGMSIPAYYIVTVILQGRDGPA
jgi:hypothetical protein